MAEDHSITRGREDGVSGSMPTLSPSSEMSGEVRRSGALRDKEGLVGRVVNDKYRVIEILARGGMGAVYRAEQLPLGRPVALKLIHAELGDEHPDSDFHRRFFLEAASCAKLTHPNIVVIHDFGRLELSEGRFVPYMAMELLEGRTLHEVLKTDAPLAFDRALKIAREVARALRVAHAEGMVHRDLKPTNVMLTRTSDGEAVKVLDFGLVKLLRDDSEELTREDIFMGSPKYMAPEQIKREPIDGRADLYALGVLLYQMLTGRVPFSGESHVQTLMAHVTEPVPPLPDDVPDRLQALVLRCLEKDRANRFENAGALIDEIDLCRAELGDQASSSSAIAGAAPRDREATMSGRLRSNATPVSSRSLLIPRGEDPAIPIAVEHASPRRSNLLWVGAAGLLALAIGGGAFAFFGREPSSPSAGRATSATDALVVATSPSPAPAPSMPVDEQPRARAFTVFVDSSPRGAEVFRGAERVGTTPTFSRVEPEDVREGGVTFRVAAAGYVPYVWTQGASSEDVRVIATLEPIPSPTTSVASGPAVGPAVQERPRSTRSRQPSQRLQEGPALASGADDDLRGAR